MEMFGFLSFMYPVSILILFLFLALEMNLAKKDKKNGALRFFSWFSVIIYFGSFFGNYQPIELFYLFWLLRDCVILLALLFLWRVFMHIKPLAVTFYIIIVAFVGLQFYLSLFKNSSNSVLTSNTETSYDASAELLFDIKNADKVADIESLLKAYSPKIEQAFPQVEDKDATELDDYYVLNVDDRFKSEIPRIITELNASGFVDWVENNDVIKTEPVTAQTLTQSSSETYNLSDTYTTKLWSFGYWEITNLVAFLDKNKPSRKAKIFILDTGIDSKHEDIDNNYVSFEKKYDTDVHGHGTHCAGIACAVTNNKIGIASLNLGNENTTVTSIKVLDDSGSGTQESVIDGIILAADNSADVISMSLGGYTTDSREQAYNAAIKYATDKGAIVVVAAGNEYDNAKNHTPACCEGVITIAAVDNNLEKAAFSNSVQDIKMKLAAPGVDIFSTFPGNDYKSMNGTSMATPYVAGLVGLMKSYNPDLTATEAYKLLNDNGKDLSNPQTGKFVQPLETLQAMEIKSSKPGFIRRIFTFKP